MSDNKRNAANKAKREYLLSGLIECTACGGTYVGHTTVSKGHEYKCYCCGTKYRNHTCSAKNINADEIETFVVQNLKMYLLALDFDEMAKKVADMINSAEDDLKSERMELLDIEAQLANGTKAILKGLDYPELQKEMFKLRVRKSELEDILGRKNPKRPVDPEKIAALFRSFAENWSTDLNEIVRSMVKIYAHPDGSYDMNIGVHIMSCGSRHHLVCKTYYFRKPA